MFRAFDPERDRLVAVKLFRVDLAPERVHQLVAEFDRLIAARLAHPIVAPPFTAGIAGTQAYLVYDFIPADSLDIVIRDNGPAPLDDAIRVATQLAGAIDYAAAVGVCHGTLHPRDVLISADDTRVTGFGVAQAFERIGVAPPLRRPYAAPERIDQTAWDRRADTYSLAAVTYELITGRRIAGAGPAGAEGIDAVQGLDAALARAVFARALAVEPALRFENALAFVEALQTAVVAGTATAAEPARAGRPSRSDPARDAEPLLPLGVAEAAPPASPVAQVPSEVTAPIEVAPPVEAAPPIEKQPVEPVARASAPIEEPPLSRAFEPEDVELVRAEAERYEDVESAPAVTPDVPIRPAVQDGAEPAIRRDVEREPPAAAPAAMPPIGLQEPTQPAPPVFAKPSALERSRSAMWPLVLALVIGVALGFGGGYAVGTRATAAPPPNREPAAPATTPEVATEPTAEPQPVPPAASAGSKSTSPAGAPAVTSRGAAPAAAAPARPAAPAPAPAPAPPPPAENAEGGRLLVRSTPAGALVTVDGRERGRTPVAIRDLARGTHRVRVEHEGYTTEERRVVLSTRTPSQSLQLTLSRSSGREATRSSATPAGEAAATGGGEAFVGMLMVESLPTGAKVYVDNKLVGTTPFEMGRVAAGSHVVRIEHDGYRRWTSSVRVVAGERNRVTASLEKLIQ